MGRTHNLKHVRNVKMEAVLRLIRVGACVVFIKDILNILLFSVVIIIVLTGCRTYPNYLHFTFCCSIIFVELK